MIQSSSDGSDAAAGVRTERLLAGANDAAALRHSLALINAEAQHRLAKHRSHYNPDQPRMPKGHPDGGEWTRTGTSGVRLAALDPRSTAPILMDARPDGVVVWTQYAEADGDDAVPKQNKADAEAIAAATVILHQIVVAVGAAVIRHPDTTARGYGVQVHTVFARIVRALSLPGIGTLQVEQSFDKNGEAKYGADGSIRTDVILRNKKGLIIAIFDLKTGNAIISPSRARELRAMTRVGPEVPVIELHSVRGPAYK